jgi:hypothetical protein
VFVESDSKVTTQVLAEDSVSGSAVEYLNELQLQYALVVVVGF